MIVAQQMEPYQLGRGQPHSTHLEELQAPPTLKLLQSAQHGLKYVFSLEFAIGNLDELRKKESNKTRTGKEETNHATNIKEEQKSVSIQKQRMIYRSSKSKTYRSFTLRSKDESKKKQRVKKRSTIVLDESML